MSVEFHLISLYVLQLFYNCKEQGVSDSVKKTVAASKANNIAEASIPTTSEQVESVPRAGLVMAILLLIFFLAMSDNQIISPLLPLIAKDFGYGEQVGRVGQLMLPAYAIAAAIAALLIGPLSDKFGRRRFLFYASILFGASLLLILFIKDIRLLAAVRVLTGFAAGTFSTCSIAYVADYFPYSRRGVAMSVVQAGYFGALVFGVPAATLIAGWQSWRHSFAFFGALSIIAFVLIATLLPEDKHTMAELALSDRMARRFGNMKLVFEGIERKAAIAAAFFVSGGFVGFFTYIGTWLQKDLNLGKGAVNLFFIIVGIALLIGAFIAGPVSDKFGKRGLSILATIVLAPMLLLIPTLTWGVPLFATFLIAALAFAFRQGPLQALATEFVPRRARGALVAVRNTASQIGIAVATVASGWLYDKLDYRAVGIFSGVMTMAAAFCIFLMKEPRGEHSEHESAKE
ncbi:MAG TPA: MFS transporter [Blastocatellia bacterium]|nr:MFS transporter [Blastocatellia bacterium]